MKKILLGLIVLLCHWIAFADNTEEEKVRLLLSERGEASVLIEAEREDLYLLTRIVSLDGKSGDGYVAYVNKKQFDELCRTGFKYTLLENNSPKAASMASDISQMASWNKYPTYEVYVQMMRNFASSYPDLCCLDTICLSENGRLILSLKITALSEQYTAKPKFFYSSSIHGDELTGMIMLLRLADSLLSSYNTNSQIQNLLSSVELYICPLANCDGAYAGGNNSVSNATRYNANYVDLNRNFPDPVYGSHADGEQYQAETIGFMTYAERKRFDLAANLHGGAEVCNYPWDCWTSSQRTHPDKAWFETICSRFVSMVKQNAPSSYFTDVATNGIVAGGNWYTVFGGRQDYHNYFLKCREITIEVSSTKTPSSSSLPLYWNYLGKGLTQFVFDATRGICGTITDQDDLSPIDSVRVIVEGIDRDDMSVFSKQEGDYFRGLEQGNYTLVFSKEGYQDKRVSVGVLSDSLLVMNVSLSKNAVSLSEQEPTNRLTICPNPCKDNLRFESDFEGDYEIVSIGGIVLKKGSFASGESTINLADLPAGAYLFKYSNKDCSLGICSTTIIKQ